MADQNEPKGEPKIKLRINQVRAPDGAAATGPSDPKKSTTRVELPKVAPPVVQPTPKKSTTRIDLPPMDPAAAKRQTSRIDLRTVMPPEPSMAKAATASIKAATGAIRPAAPQAPGMGPKTIRIRRDAQPVAQPAERPSGTTGGEGVTQMPTDVGVAKKAETARIELPEGAEDRPQATRKTIRIKRTDGGGATATVRPVAVTAQPTLAAMEDEALSDTEEEMPGALFSVMALVATLVAMVLVYALIAQLGTLDAAVPAKMPFPGMV